MKWTRRIPWDRLLHTRTTSMFARDAIQTYYGTTNLCKSPKVNVYSEWPIIFHIEKAQMVLDFRTKMLKMNSTTNKTGGSISMSRNSRSDSQVGKLILKNQLHLYLSIFFSWEIEFTLQLLKWSLVCLIEFGKKWTHWNSCLITNGDRTKITVLWKTKYFALPKPTM